MAGVGRVSLHRFTSTAAERRLLDYPRLARTQLWAQQQNPDPNLMVQFEQRLAESDSEAKHLTGAPKELWLLRKLEIEKTIWAFRQVHPN
jgi:hypothetical protein